MHAPPRPGVLPVRLGAEAPALTIYNRDFAVVRERIPLDLKSGTNVVSFAGATVHLEPDSVVLRDPAGRITLQVLEQSFRADTISQGLLLYLNEGKEIDFRRTGRDGQEEIVRGKILRSGYTPNYAAMSRFGTQFTQRQQALGNWQSGAGSPIVQFGGRLQFSVYNGAAMQEAFEIKLRNRKKVPVTVRVAERLYRGVNWEIIEKSHEFEKTDAQSIEFRVGVAPDQETIVTYRGRYDWR